MGDEIQALAKRLGGGWRMEGPPDFQVMPTVVLTQPEAERLAARIERADVQLQHLADPEMVKSLPAGERLAWCHAQAAYALKVLRGEAPAE